MDLEKVYVKASDVERFQAHMIQLITHFVPTDKLEHARDDFEIAKLLCGVNFDASDYKESYWGSKTKREVLDSVATQLIEETL